MSEHAHPAKEELKKHGDVLDQAMHEEDGHTGEQESHVEVDPIPAPDNGGHARSQAAHLGDHVHGHTKPAGNLRQGASPGQRREPPQDLGRVGKTHRGQ